MAMTRVRCCCHRKWLVSCLLALVLLLPGENIEAQVPPGHSDSVISKYFPPVASTVFIALAIAVSIKAWNGQKQKEDRLKPVSDVPQFSGVLTEYRFLSPSQPINDVNKFTR